MSQAAMTATTGAPAERRTVTLVERRLFPNVDFYSGITLRAMGFPTGMFTVLFAVARAVGWIAQPYVPLDRRP